MNKYVDRLFDSPWFIRVIALVLALLLFENVYDVKNDIEENVPQSQETETIEDVAVKSYYDTENLVITGVPETVKVTFTGPKNILQQAITQQDFEVYVDLTKAEIGTHKVPIEIKNISERLDVKIEPSSANVSVQEKVTQEFSVKAEFNDEILADGYFSENARINPEKVKITGARDVIERIVYVKANLDVQGPIRETLMREAEVLVLDNELNKLNVTVEPKTVDVTIPIKVSSKKVPIQIEQSGTPPNGLSVESATLEVDEATIIGDEKVLDEVGSVRVELDLSKIVDDTVITLPVIVPDGVSEVSPKTVEVRIKLSENDTKTISGIPIKIEGLSEQYTATFQDPKNGAISLSASGPLEDVRELNESHFDVFIDVANLGKGNHDVAINVVGPDHIDWKLGKSTAKISITQKEA